MAERGEGRDDRKLPDLRQRRRHPDEGREGGKPDRHRQREKGDQRPGGHHRRQPLGDQVGQTEAGRRAELRDLARGHLAQARPQDHQRADQGHEDRHDPADGEFFAEEERRADRHHDRVEIADRRDLGDRDAGHRVEPQAHRYDMQRPAPGDEPRRVFRQPRPQDGDQRRRQEDEPDQEAQEGGLDRGQRGAEMAHGPGHGDKAQPRRQDPEDTGDRPVLRRKVHAATEAHRAGGRKPYPRATETAMDHMIAATARSRMRHASARAKSGASSRAP